MVEKNPEFLLHSVENFKYMRLYCVFVVKSDILEVFLLLVIDFVLSGPFLIKFKAFNNIPVQLLNVFSTIYNQVPKYYI